MPKVEEKKVYEKVSRKRNEFGDFVVTKINIKEREIPTVEQDVSEDSESEEEESEQEEEKTQVEGK